MAMNYDPYGDPSQLYQQPGQPQQGGSLADFQRDYWAPDREQVLAGMQQPQGGAMSSTYRNDWTAPYAGQFGGGQQPQGQMDWTGKSVTPDMINGYFASRGTTPNSTSASYWTQKWPELYQRGLEIGNPNYAFQRLQYADEFLPGGPTTSPFYEGPQGGGSGYGQTGGGSQIASVTPSSTSSSVAPTWAAMLGNTSAYKKQSDPTGPNMGRISDPAGPMTLAQMFGMGR